MEESKIENSECLHCKINRIKSSCMEISEIVFALRDKISDEEYKLILDKSKIIFDTTCTFENDHDSDHEEEIEIDIDTCPNCHINKITTFVPCKQHSYCDKCLLKNNCYICKSYLIYHKKIR